MKSILVLLFIALAPSAWAEDSAGTIKSNGVAQLEKVSDFLLFSSSKKWTSESHQLLMLERQSLFNILNPARKPLEDLQLLI